MVRSRSVERKGVVNRAGFRLEERLKQIQYSCVGVGSKDITNWAGYWVVGMAGKNGSSKYVRIYVLRKDMACQFKIPLPRSTFDVSFSYNGQDSKRKQQQKIAQCIY